MHSLAHSLWPDELSLWSCSLRACWELFTSTRILFFTGWAINVTWKHIINQSISIGFSSYFYWYKSQGYFIVIIQIGSVKELHHDIKRGKYFMPSYLSQHWFKSIFYTPSQYCYPKIYYVFSPIFVISSMCFQFRPGHSRNVRMLVSISSLVDQFWNIVIQFLALSPVFVNCSSNSLVTVAEHETAKKDLVRGQLSTFGGPVGISWTRKYFDGILLFEICWIF